MQFSWKIELFVQTLSHNNQMSSGLELTLTVVHGIVEEGVYESTEECQADAQCAAVSITRPAYHFSERHRNS